MRDFFIDPDSAFYKSAAPLDVDSIDQEAFVPFLSIKFALEKRKIDRNTLDQFLGRAPPLQSICLEGSYSGWNNSTFIRSAGSPRDR